MTKTRRIISVALIVGGIATAALTLGGCGSGASSTNVSASTVPASNAPTLADHDQTGRELVIEFITSLQQSDIAATAAMLAPNFQLLRADGSYANRDDYLKNPAKVTTFKLGESVVGMQYGDTLTVRWSTQIGEHIDGDPYSKVEAGRLTSFVWDGQRWLITSYANFNLPS